MSFFLSICSDSLPFFVYSRSVCRSVQMTSTPPTFWTTQKLSLLKAYNCFRHRNQYSVLSYLAPTPDLQRNERSMLYSQTGLYQNLATVSRSSLSGYRSKESGSVQFPQQKKESSRTFENFREPHHGIGHYVRFDGTQRGFETAYHPILYVHLSFFPSFSPWRGDTHSIHYCPVFPGLEATVALLRGNPLLFQNANCLVSRHISRARCDRFVLFVSGRSRLAGFLRSLGEVARSSITSSKFSELQE